MSSLDTVAQVVLPILVVTTLLLIARRNRWGFVLGLATQPFWFCTYLVHRQWGAVVTAVFSTFAFVVGVREWFGPDRTAAGDGAR